MLLEVSLSWEEGFRGRTSHSYTVSFRSACCERTRIGHSEYNGPQVISVCKLIESYCPSSPSIPKASCHAQGNVPSGTPSLLKPDCHSRSRAMLDRHSCASLADYQHSESQGVTQGVRHLAKEVGS